MKRFRQLIGVALVAMCFSSTHTSEAAGLADRAKVEGSYLDGYNDAGERVWRYRSEGPLQLDTHRDGVFELNGRELVGRDGRLLMRLNPHAGPGASLDGPITFGTAAETWSAVTDIFIGSPYYLPPVFDSSGNAWIVVSDNSANGGTQVLKSNGHTGTWSTVGGPFAQAFWGGSMTIDSKGDVTMACYCSSVSGELQVNVARYEPATGWSAVQTIYNAPPTGDTPAQNVYVVADAAGDAIVAADITTYGAASFFYSNSTKTWTGPTQVPMPLTIDPYIKSVSMPNLSASPNGQYIQYTYAASTNIVNPPALGLYTNAFNTTTHAFGLPALVPKSNKNLVYYTNYDMKVPAFVDNTGAITAVWGNAKSNRKNYTAGSRYEKGRWKTANLGEMIPFDGEFSSQAMDASGNMLFSAESYVGTNYEEMEVQVFKYLVGTGWSSSVATSWAGDTTSRQRIAWLGTSGNIVLSYMLIPVSVTDYTALSSTIYNGSTWTESSPVPPTGVISLFLDSATDTSGNVLLVYDPECAVQPQSGVCLVTDAMSTFMTP